MTKGSFYWHFPTREALIKAALERWERRDEDEVMAPIEPIADPRERLRELFQARQPRNAVARDLCGADAVRSTIRWSSRS